MFSLVVYLLFKDIYGETAAERNTAKMMRLEEKLEMSQHMNN